VVIVNGKVSIFGDDELLATYNLNASDDEIYEAIISKINSTIEDLMHKS